MIVINKPYIEVEQGENQGWVKLCSDIQLDGETTTIWYEVEEEYSKYLCHEKADAFLVAILPLAMAFSHNIEVKDAPISEKLYWQLENMMIPALSKYSNYYKNIEIQTEISNETYDSFAVGTGFSAGVDSFYTVLKNLNKRTSDFNITHLTFFNVGACGSYGGKAAEERFKNRISKFQQFASGGGDKLRQGELKHKRICYDELQLHAHIQIFSSCFGSAKVV